MHKAKLVALKDGTTYENLRVIDSDDSLLIFMEEGEKKFIRLIPWNNVQHIDYDDPQAIEHVKAVAMMAMLDVMDDIDDSIEEIEQLEVNFTTEPKPEPQEAPKEGDKSELTKNPYGE